jgi:hypothetical protein
MAAETAKQLGEEVLWLYRNAFQGVAIAGVRNWDSAVGFDGIASIAEVNTISPMQMHHVHWYRYLPIGVCDRPGELSVFAHCFTLPLSDSYAVGI